LSVVGDLGGPNAYVYLSATKRDAVPTLLGNAIVITAVQSILLIGIGIPVVLSVLHPYPTLIPIALVFFVSYIPVNLLTRYLNAINQGTGRFVEFNAVRLSIQVTYVAGVVGLFVLHLHRVRWALVVLFISQAAAAALAIRQWLPGHWRVGWRIIGETFHYGIRSHFGNLTPIDSLQLDLAFVILALGPRDAGLYAVAAGATMVIRTQGISLGMVALPQVASARGQAERVAMIGGIFRLSLGLSLFAAALILLTAGLVVPLVYGSQFADAVSIARVLAVAMALAALRQVLGDCLRGAGWPLRATLSEVVGWLVAIFGLIILVHRAGATGAALAVSLSYASSLAVSAFFAWRLGVSPGKLLVPRRSDVTMATSIVKQVAAGVRNSGSRLRSVVRLMARSRTEDPV
jgi:O-antigen/teichoic acid export membrane protein